jgi:ABC-type bacteriocin/lantibiotic exporter with double-glycine peptidase domain
MTARRPRRVPVLRQMDAVECGAACLAMVLSYHGRRTTVAECAARIGVGRDGQSAAQLAAAARAEGLQVRAYTLEPADLRLLAAPLIVHWEFNHFVVVERWSPAGVDIVDPAIGRRHLSPEAFDLGFTGVALACEPGSGFEARRAGGRSWTAYLRTYALQAPGTVAQIVLVSVLLQALGLALPVASAVLIDHVLPRQAEGVLPILGIGLVVLALAQAVASYLRGALLVYLQTRVDGRLMTDFFEHLLALPYRFFERRSTGDLLMRLGSNAVIRETLTGQTLSVILDGTMVLGYLAVLLLRDLALGGLVLTVATVQVALLVGTNRRARALADRDLHAQSAAQGYLVEALNGIAAIKAAGAEERAFDRWANLFTEQLNVSARRGQLAAGIEASLAALRAFAPLALLWLGTARVIAGDMSLGTMLALNALAIAALTPLSSLVTNAQRVALVGAHLERLADVLEAEPEQADDSARQPASPDLSGRIALEGVRFRYDPHAPWALRDVTLTVEPGRKIALVGRSGSGKSTLGRLLLGLYPPTGGTLRYDGTPLEAFDLRELRRRFGVVLQDPTLFAGSIRQNIALNDPDLPLERIAHAARLAGIHDDVEILPMGYETRLGEGGAGLSGGQLQRLALARALAHEPAVLLLDEATSHLDVATEALVERNLATLACTRIVIAHRLSTVRDADLIVVLDRGEIVECGTHDELMARGDRYAALVRGQSADAPIPAA